MLGNRWRLEFPQQPGWQPQSDDRILEELERVLASREFVNAERAARFLRFAVERTLAGDRESLKESVIGAAVFDRRIGYDPKAEPIVRTEARRLRSKLSQYYQTAGRDAAIQIAVPTGGYVAAFLPKNAAPPKLAVMPRPEPVEETPVAEAIDRQTVHVTRFLLWRPVPAMLAVATVAVAIGWWRGTYQSRNRPEFALSTVTSYPGAQYSPALSPDGRQVAFAWSEDPTIGYDLYLVSADGGVPKRVTTGHAADDMPSWSADGSQLAFIRHASSLMVMSLAGGGERILGTAYPSFVDWAPKSNLILYCAWVPGRNRLAIFAIDATTGVKRQLTAPETSIGDTIAAASPDGREFAFLRCALDNCDIYAMPLAGGRSRRITHDECSFNGLAWMPDGRSIVYSNQRRGPYMMWQIDSSGFGKPEEIPSSADDVRFPKARFGPSGRARIVFEQRVRSSNIWRQQLDPDRAKSSAPGPERLIASTRLDSSPQISPDGRRIVFASDRTGYDEIWIADADGGNQRALTNIRGHLTGSPRWSPDGNRVAFDAIGNKGRAVFLIDSRGGQPRQWTPWGDAARPSWSRDGRWIYYGASDSSGNSQVWKISTADHTIKQVTRDGGFEAYESLDGRTLYYVSGAELRRVPVGGGSWTRVTDHPINHGWWSVSARGIYFAGILPPNSHSRNGPFPVFFLNPLSGLTREVTSIDGPLASSSPDFDISGDGRTLVYSRREVSTSQIRMLEVRP